jgi:hypothetical protein
VEYVGEEWADAHSEGRRPDIHNLRLAAVAERCAEDEADHPSWYPDLYKTDLTSLLETVAPDDRWWLPPLQANAQGVGEYRRRLHITSNSSFPTERVSPAAPPAAAAAAAAPAATSAAARAATAASVPAAAPTAAPTPAPAPAQATPPTESVGSAEDGDVEMLEDDGIETPRRTRSAGKCPVVVSPSSDDPPKRRRVNDPVRASTVL